MTGFTPAPRASSSLVGIRGLGNTFATISFLTRDYSSRCGRYRIGRLIFG